MDYCHILNDLCSGMALLAVWEAMGVLRQWCTLLMKHGHCIVRLLVIVGCWDGDEEAYYYYKLWIITFLMFCAQGCRYGCCGNQWWASSSGPAWTL